MADKKSDVKQIAQSVFDEATQAAKVKITDTEISVELSADDGDSVEARKPLFSQKVTVVEGTPSGTVLAVGDARYFNEYLLAVNVLETITAAGLKVDIQVSPSDVDEVWDPSPIAELSIPNTGFNHIKDTTIGPWRRARAVLIDNGFTAGSFDLYANGR